MTATFLATPLRLFDSALPANVEECGNVENRICRSNPGRLACARRDAQTVPVMGLVCVYDRRGIPTISSIADVKARGSTSTPTTIDLNQAALLAKSMSPYPASTGTRMPPVMPLRRCWPRGIEISPTAGRRCRRPASFGEEVSNGKFDCTVEVVLGRQITGAGRCEGSVSPLVRLLGRPEGGGRGIVCGGWSETALLDGQTPRCKAYCSKPRRCHRQ